MTVKNNLVFISPTYGQLTFEEVMKRVFGFMKEEPSEDYGIIIGSDSQGVNSGAADFVSAIVVHRVGHGGVYFWQRRTREQVYGLRDRIYKEATDSLELAEKVIQALKAVGLWQGLEIENGLSRKNGFPSLEIHVDIGRKGPTRELINEVIGMIRGAGYVAKMKPEAIGAASVADRYT